MKNTYIEADHFPQLAENRHYETIAAQLGLDEVDLINGQIRRDKLSNIAPSVLLSGLVSVNAMVQGRDAAEGALSDGTLAGLVTPPVDQKEPLLEQSLEVFQDILGNPSLKDEIALERAGLMLAGAITWIHPFADGNGRTGRFVHYITQFGAERGDQLVEDEMRSIFARAPVYDHDVRPAIQNAPLGSLGIHLLQHHSELHPSQHPFDNRRQQAAVKVAVYLDEMAGSTEVKTGSEQPHFRYPTVDRNIFAGSSSDLRDAPIPEGMRVADVYLESYRRGSFAASIDPWMIPVDAKLPRLII